MLDHVLDQRILHVWRIRHRDLLVAITGLQADGVIIEDRETDLPLGADNLDTVLAGTLMGHIAPRARAGHTVLETETGTHGVLGLIISATISTDTPCLENHTEHILQQIELMGRHIIEIASAGNLRLQSPRQGRAVRDGLGISGAQRLCIAYLHIQDLTYPATLDNLLHLLEIRQVTAVIGHKAGDARLLRNAVDTGAVIVTGRQGLLHVDRLARLHRHDGVGGMAGWRRSHIDGIHVRIINEFLGVCVPLLDAVGTSIVTGMLFRTAHHRHDTRARHLAEGRTALALSHITATYEPPLQISHVCVTIFIIQVQSYNFH